MTQNNERAGLYFCGGYYGPCSVIGEERQSPCLFFIFCLAVFPRTHVGRSERALSHGGRWLFQKNIVSGGSLSSPRPSNRGGGKWSGVGPGVGRAPRAPPRRGGIPTPGPYGSKRAPGTGGYPRRPPTGLAPFPPRNMGWSGPINDPPLPPRPKCGPPNPPPKCGLRSRSKSPPSPPTPPPPSPPGANGVYGGR